VRASEQGKTRQKRQRGQKERHGPSGQIPLASKAMWSSGIPYSRISRYVGSSTSSSTGSTQPPFYGCLVDSSPPGGGGGGGGAAAAAPSLLTTGGLAVFRAIGC